MSVTEREAETATVEAKKAGGIYNRVDCPSGKQIRQKNRRAIGRSSYNKGKKIGDCETILPLLFN